VRARATRLGGAKPIREVASMSSSRYLSRRQFIQAGAAAGVVTAFVR
jgi:hypothetical protein